MPMIQLRNVPAPLHRQLKARAALEGISLSEYLIAELRRLAARPTRAELRQRLAARRVVRPRVAPSDVLRAERDRR